MNQPRRAEPVNVLDLNAPSLFPVSPAQPPPAS